MIRTTHPEFYSADIPPGCLTSKILFRRHSTQMSHIRNSSPPTFHPGNSHLEFFSADIPPGYLTSGIPFGRRSTFFGCLTSGILSDRRSTFSGYFTVGTWRRMGEEGDSTSLLDSVSWITAQVRIHICSGHFQYACLDSHMCMITLSIHWFPHQLPWLLHFISRDPSLGT